MSAIDIALRTLERLCEESDDDTIRLQAAATILAHVNGVDFEFNMADNDAEIS